jgi:glutamine cyclotransferase
MYFKPFKQYYLACLLLIGLASLHPVLKASNTPLLWDYQLLNSAPHNPNSFTQGFLKDGDTFYESSGLYGRSFIERYQQGSITRANLPKGYFAEGLTLFNDQLYVLTWKEGTLLILDKTTLQVRRTLFYSGEGWGLTHNDQYLIMSNGSHVITFRDPNDFSIVKSLSVQGLSNINELEYVDGTLWANSLNDNHIYAINPKNGCIIGKMDLTSLRTQTIKPEPNNVLNGIAYDKAVKALWVTGKYWPKRYLIALPVTRTDQITKHKAPVGKCQ